VDYLFSTAKARQILVSFFKNYYLIPIALVFTLIASMIVPSFTNSYNIQSILIMMSIYGFLALGQCMCMFIAEVNMALGANIAFAPITAMTITRMIYRANGIEIVRARIYLLGGGGFLLVFTLVVSVLLMLLIGFIVVNYRLPSLLVTFGMQNVLIGLCYLIGGQFNMILTEMKYIDIFGSVTVGRSVPISLIILLFFVVSIALLLKYTRFGVYIHATGGNEKAAIYAGIKTRFWKMLAYAISGVCSGMAAIFYSSRLQSIAPTQGLNLQFFGLSVAVLGGIKLRGGGGNVIGTFLSSLLIALIINFMQMSVIPSWYQTIIMGAVVMTAAVLQQRQPSRSKLN